ncbi:salicylate hydroxylase [Lecanosticta acicola]|uniref:Salicylate hydroxylase n=1 Tax=Lecanosticta acicola TaxID=111012 RepID=A0AAI8Z609_9PEZI|nr:salicylate hydroxylase [Lecanosticta acicola]
MPLKVIIVGGGISGLCAGVSLSQAGHSVKVLERSKFSNEVGAGITLAPNGVLVLRKMGFDFQRAKGCELANWSTFEGGSLETMSVQDLHKAKERFGAEFYGEVKSQGDECSEMGSKPGISLQLNSKVVRIDPDLGRVELENGTVEEADLVVAADGVHSAIRQRVFGAVDFSARSTNMSAFRFFIPREQMMQLEAGRRLVEWNASHTGATMFVDTTVGMYERYIAWYDVSGGELQNFVCIHPTRTGDRAVGDTRSQLLDEYKHFNQDLVELISLSEKVTSWPLLGCLPLPTWTKGKLVLIGDAAHPMLTFGGQGANQAVEDGGALGVLFRNMSSAAEVPERLALFEQVRHKRASRVQLLSSVRAGNEHLVKEDMKRFMEPGVDIPETFAGRVAHDSG